MMRSFVILIGLMLFAVTALGFDEEKMKADYLGAEFRVAGIKESIYENAPAIVVNFTAPLSKRLLKDRHALLDGGESENWILSDDRTMLIFPFVSPETEYSVHIAGDIRDINGQKLGQPIREKIKTRKLEPSVAFSSNGHILSSSSPKRLPVVTVNIDEVTVDFFRIHSSKIPGLIKVLGRTGKRDNYELDRIRTFGTLVYSGRFELKHKKNQRTEHNINLEPIGNLKKPGLYAAVLTSPGIYEYQHEYTFFMQTDIGLHVRRYEKTMDVYAQDITTGKPLENVSVEVVDAEGIMRDKNATDEYGRARFFIDSGQNCVIAAKGEQMSVLPIYRDSLDLSGLKNALTSHSQYQIFAWGPRDIYRPAENIAVNILVRDYDGRLPPSIPLSYTLYKPDGSGTSSDEIQPAEKGFYTFSYRTAETSQTGRYHLKLTFGEDNTASYYFNVEEVVPERLDLELFDGQWDKKRIIATPATVAVPVSAMYLYGTPASGNKVDGFVTAEVDPHPFENFQTFYFGDPGEKFELKRKEFKEIHLSENGTGQLAMDNEWSKITSPLRLDISASVYETGGRPVSRRSSVTLLNADRFIGIEPQFSDSPDADSTVEVKVGCLAADGQWLKHKRLIVSLVRQDRNYYWRNSSGRGWRWEYDETPVVVFAKTVETDETGTTLVSLPLSWGNYRVEVGDGNVLSAHEFETSWSWWGNAENGSGQKPETISLGFDRKHYTPGETARLRIDPPQDGMALITVESAEKALFTAYRPVTSEGTEVDIPTGTDWDRHDYYASVMVIRPGDMKETPVPTRSFGMVHLPLQRVDTRLDVAIAAPDRVEPNRPVTAKIKVDAGAPLPESTRVVVSLVDVGILNLTRFKTPDAHAYFYAPRRYSVDLFDNYGQVIDNLGPLSALLRFGGGFQESEADLARGGNDPRSEVLMVSFFSPPLIPDENGEVTARFDLPNFNGRLRWMVLAYTDDTFGHADANTTVAARVVTQLAMPRFLARGDTSALALDLRNNSGENQALTVEMTTGGSLAERSDVKRIDLADRQKTTLRYPVEAVSDSGRGEIRLHVTGAAGDIDIERNWNIGCRSAYPSVTRSAYSTIEPGGSWRPDLVVDDLAPETVQFQMTLSNRPPIDVAEHFNYLLHYPYGCLEQAISSGYPWVLAPPGVLTQLGLDKQVTERFKLTSYDDAFRLEQINAAVHLVLDRQKVDGGFGLWSSDSPEEKWLTVYAAEFLHDAEKAGAAVSTQALQNVERKLRKYLAGNEPRNYARWSENFEYYEFAFRSYAGYVLAKAGRASIGDLRRLAETYRGRTENAGLSWLFMAAAFKLSGDANNALNCFRQAMAERNREPHRYYGEYGSEVRDLSRITELIYSHGFEGSGQLVFDLADTARDRRWLSTQERICLLRVALPIETAGTDPWNATLVTRKITQKLEDRRRAYNTLFDLETYKEFQEVQAGAARLYMRLNLSGNSRKAPKPQSNDMAVTRTFYDMDGNAISFDRMRSGELAVVRLDVSSKHRTPDGLVVDLLPAGVEIENQNLESAGIRLDDVIIDGTPVNALKSADLIKYEEFREDRYVAAVDINRQTGSVSLFYLVRAVTPGTYSVPCSYVEDMYRPYRFAIGGNPGTIEISE